MSKKIMVRVLFMTRSLNTGGAQRQLTELVRAIDKRRFDITVATFYPGGKYWDEMCAIPGVRVTSLEKFGRWDVTGAWRSSLRLARNIRPHIIYSFRNEANLLALPLAWAVRAKIIWGIRRSSNKITSRDLLVMGIFWVGAALSYYTDRVVYNSFCGRNLHISRGYCGKNAVVISNGFETARFQPDIDARLRQRMYWSVGEKDLLVGIVGRLDPVKNHGLFIEVASRLKKEYPYARFAVIGGGSAKYSDELVKKKSEADLNGRLLWIGESNDMRSCYNALDILVLCSTEEGCPNVVGEAMACGVPCVVTDVGDAAMMVGNTGLVVPPGNPDAMTVGWSKMLGLEWKERRSRGLAARRRIKSEYNLERMVERTTNLMEEMISFNRTSDV
jgi:glycosyltransferase involved in cell wall biosynthesis